MPTPGRNDPCPCGSGKKFKRCCGSAGPAPGITRDDRNAAMAALLRFSSRDEFAHVTASTAIAWAVDDFGDDAGAALASFLDFQPATSAYFEWLFFDNPLDDGRSLAERFLAGPARHLSPRVVDYIRLMSGTHLHPYQIRKVVPDQGLQVRDLWTGEDRFISERAATTEVRRWQVLVARLASHTNGSLQMEGTPFVLPAAARRDLISDLKHAHKSYAKEPDASDLDFFRTHAPLFHDYWMEWPDDDQEVEWTTTEGDPMSPVEIAFDVPTAGIAMVALLSEPDFSAGRFGSVVWLDRSSGQEVCLATVEVSQGTLTLHAVTPARAHRARARIEQVLGPLAPLPDAPVRDGIAQMTPTDERRRNREPRATLLPFGGRQKD